MMDSYDLFSAMSGADEELVSRSDYSVKRHRSRWPSLLAIAACFALILISIATLYKKPVPESLYTPPTTGISETENTIPATIDPDSPLQLNGSSVGTLNIMQLSYTEQANAMPDFLMYINQNEYHIAESAGAYYIYPVSGGSTNRMTLSWQPNSTLENAVQHQLAALASTMDTVSEPVSDPLLGGTMILGSNSQMQTEVYLTSDLQSGVFIFTLSFDSNDHAIWFRDMIQTFEVLSAKRNTPVWMTDLQNTVVDFTSAFLENDLSGVDDLISQDAEIYTYGADIRSETRILQTHYEVDEKGDAAPTSATVSVRHKYLENDAYDYITMELAYCDGKWQILWAMIER